MICVICDQAIETAKPFFPFLAHGLWIFGILSIDGRMFNDIPLFRSITRSTGCTMCITVEGKEKASKQLSSLIFLGSVEILKQHCFWNDETQKIGYLQ